MERGGEGGGEMRQRGGEERGRMKRSKQMEAGSARSPGSIFRQKNKIKRN